MMGGIVLGPKSTVRIKTLLWVTLACVAMISFVTGCGPKDVVTFLGMDNHDLYIGDIYGNKVKVEEPAEFFELFKSAKHVGTDDRVVLGPNGLGPDEQYGAYVFYSGEGKVFYTEPYSGDPYIYIYVGDSPDTRFQRLRYSVCLNELLGKIEKLPLVFERGLRDGTLYSCMHDLCDGKEPLAMIFPNGDIESFVVCAGTKSAPGRELKIDNILVHDGIMTVDVRSVESDQGAYTYSSYLWQGFSMTREADFNVRLITPEEGTDETLEVPVFYVFDEPSGESERLVMLKRPKRHIVLKDSVRLEGYIRKIGIDSSIVEIRDEHTLLGTHPIVHTELVRSGDYYDYFSFSMGFEPASTPNGTITIRTTPALGGATVEELVIPVMFEGG